MPKNYKKPTKAKKPVIKNKPTMSNYSKKLTKKKQFAYRRVRVILVLVRSGPTPFFVFATLKAGVAPLSAEVSGSLTSTEVFHTRKWCLGG